MRDICTTVISTIEAHELLGRAIFIDTRHQLSDRSWGEEGYRAGHIPGALFLHLDRDLSAKATGRNGRHPLPQPEGFVKLLRREGVRPGQQVIVYDQDIGSFAARLWWMLNKWLGYGNAAVLDGGFSAWIDAGYAVSSIEVESKIETVDDDMVTPDTASSVVTQQQVRANLDTPTFQVVDARGPERYRGDVEPIDPVAGHIPGAINRPFMANIQENGRFKSQEKLRHEWCELLNNQPPEEVVHYCGSGVTSCHNILAMEHAGLIGSRLYAGSWSEWCADPENPMVRG